MFIVFTKSHTRNNLSKPHDHARTNSLTLHASSVAVVRGFGNGRFALQFDTDIATQLQRTTVFQRLGPGIKSPDNSATRVPTGTSKASAKMAGVT